VVRWGKNKCGATVYRFASGVAPLLVLLKRWLFFSFFVCRFIVALSFFTMTANVLQLPEGRDFYHKTSFGVLNFQLAQMCLQSTKPRLLGKCC